jgi:hypothetical protein
MSFGNDYMMSKIHHHDAEAQEQFAETQRFIQEQRRQHSRLGNFVKTIVTSIAMSLRQNAVSATSPTQDESLTQDTQEIFANTQYGQRVMASS